MLTSDSKGLEGSFLNDAPLVWDSSTKVIGETHLAEDSVVESAVGTVVNKLHTAVF